MTTLSAASTVIVPTLVTGYTSTRAVRSIVHDVPGAAEPDVTLRPARLRSGTLELLFGDVDAESASAAAEAALSDILTWTLSDDEPASVTMRFVVAGADITRTLEDATRAAWLVTLPFQEIAP